MNKRFHKSSPTRRSDQLFDECLAIARRYLKTNPSIRNQDLRQASGIGYDQAIHFFNRAIQENQLVRQGSGSGSCYVLPKRQAKQSGRK